MERKIYLSNTPLNSARELFWQEAAKKMEKETFDTTAACGRITAGPVWARFSSPHYHASAMDGVAVKSSDTFGAVPTSPRRLRLEENAFYVDTGGPLPPGCDAVIMIENVYFPREETPEVIEIREAATPWQHVRTIGEDIVATEMILPAYHRIRPCDMGALLGGGVFQVEVLKKPRVAIIPTGKELVSPGTDPAPGEIIDSNTWTFAAAVQEWGGEPISFPITRDDPQKLESALREAASKADLILISAGSSAGRRDYTHDVLNQAGRVFVHGVAMKPGKPVILGAFDKVPVVGVPGYPVAAYMVLELFVYPLLCRWQEIHPAKRETLKVHMSRRVLSSLKEEEFLRLKLGKVEGRFVAAPLPRGSGVTMSLVRADGVAAIPQDREGVEAGEEIEVALWKPKREIENTIVCLGSHDLSLDVLSDHLGRKQKDCFFSSANLGSMGGIMALKRKEAHLAGMHLLDPESGRYNVPYLERYLSGEPLHLVHLAQRDLGLIVSPGNPLGIESMEDLCREEVVFVNRQKGAGTRIYLDYVLREKGIDPAEIKGYHREEYNHLAVAAAVAAGSAQAGLGISAAAKALGMVFIPLAQESYQLAIAGSFFQTPRCRLLLEVIASEEFRGEIEALGGYGLARSGELVWQSLETQY